MVGYKRKIERGAAMVETAMVMGFLIFIVLSVIDLFFLFSTYTTYNQIAREGVMVGVGMNTLFDQQSSCGVTHTNLTPVAQNCSSGASNDCGHLVMQWRISKVIATMKPGFFTSSSIKTTCTGGTPKTLQVELQGNFRGYSPIFKNLNITVRHWGMVAS